MHVTSLWNGIKKFFKKEEEFYKARLVLGGNMYFFENHLNAMNIAFEIGLLTSPRANLYWEHFGGDLYSRFVLKNSRYIAYIDVSSRKGSKDDSNIIKKIREDFKDLLPKQNYKS